MLAIRLDDEIEKRLSRLAKKTGRTKTFYAREAILRHLDDLEDYHGAAAAVEEPGAVYSSSDAKKELTQVEKLRRMEELWSELSAEPDSFESPAWHEDVLKQRDAELAAGKAEFISLDEAKRELQRRRSR